MASITKSFKYEEAIVEYDKAIAINPRNSDIYNNKVSFVNKFRIGFMI